MEKKVVIQLTDGNFKQEVLKSDKPVLVDFWAQWCSPCLIVAPTVEKIAVQYKEKLKVGKVNVDEASDTTSKYGVMSIPTLMVFKNGEIVNKVIGAVSKNELEEAIKPYI